MNSRPTLSNRLGFLATLILAFIVPWWSLALAGMIQLNLFPAAVIPFGLNRIVLAYLAMAFPFCWLASAAMEKVVRPKTWVGKAVLAMLGLVAALVTVQWGPILTGGNAEPDVDLVERHAIRIIWILLLQFAWVWLARLLRADGIASSESDADGPRSLDFVIAISLLVFAPLAYGDYEMGRQFTVLQNAMRNSQKRTAWEVATRLLALGPTKNLATTVANQPDPWASAKQNLPQTANQLSQSLVQLQQTLADAQTNPPTTTEQIISLAYDYYFFQDYAAAIQLLESAGLLKDHAEAFRIVGFCYEQAGEYPLAADSFKQSIELVLAEPDRTNSTNVLQMLYERYANNLRRSDRRKEVPAILEQEIEEWPEGKGFLLYQLGLHHEMAVHPLEAEHYYQQALEVDATLTATVNRRLADLYHSRPGCMFHLPKWGMNSSD